jgi:ankyrin repeat protein
MHISEFLQKYEYRVNTITKEFMVDWENVKKHNISVLPLLMEQIIEKQYNSNLIIDLYNSAPDKQKEEFKNHPDLFKWAAAYQFPEVIKFFHKELNVKDEQGAINAAIINFRLDNLKTLVSLGINVFTDKYFCQAIKRSYQPQQSDIVEYYLDNKDKFEMTDFSKDLLIKQHKELVGWAISDKNLDKVSYLIKEGSEFNKGELFNKVCMNGHLKAVKYLLNSEDFKLRPDVPQLTDKELSEGFMYAVWNEHMDIVEYLVFEQNIKKTRHITSNTKENPEIISLFRARDLNRDLKNKDDNTKTAKKLKI